MTDSTNKAEDTTTVAENYGINGCANISSKETMVEERMKGRQLLKSDVLVSFFLKFRKLINLL